MRRLIVLGSTFATLACVGTFATAQARDASPWEEQPHAAVRLIAGSARSSEKDAAAVLRAGLEIRLDPGWKTYWRYPGDSGVPPTFDFAQSANVKSVTVLWPAPERFADGAGGHSIGYTGDIVLPLRVVAQGAAKPALLHVKLNYAICGTLCVPAEADLKLAVSGKGGTEDSLLTAAEAHVPRKVPLGAGGDLAITAVKRAGGAEHNHVVVDVTAPVGTPVELFVEGPTPEWALPLPEPTSPAAGAAPTMRRFVFALDGLPPGAHAEGAMLTITAVSPRDAIEVQSHLD
jgi:DsbC/DsbD-like thiol-disulfide interchange protein